MAVIAVTATDTGDLTTRWAIPDEKQLNNSPIPRGLREYKGTAAVPALGAGDQTNVGITFSFPSNFIYLAKSFTCSFVSDDLTSEFGNLGNIEYEVGGSASIANRIEYPIKSEGQSFRSAVKSDQTYVPLGTWRRFINGSNGDFFAFFLADMSGDASTAGDVSWFADFLVYDVEQCFNWPVNTPLIQLPY